MSNSMINELKKHDAAPEAALSDYDRARSDALLREVLADASTPSNDQKPSKKAKVRGWAIAGAGVAAALILGGVVIAPHVIHHTIDARGPLTSVELASWTAKSAPVTSAASATAKDWCLGLMAAGPGAGSPTTVTNQDQRGLVASMVIHRAGYSMLCIAGAGGTGFWELDGTPTDAAPAVAADGITEESAGSHGDGATGFTYVEGYVGSDVASITITDAGKTFPATVEAGRWTAWWPTPNPHGTVTGTITITTTEGASHTISGESLSR